MENKFFVNGSYLEVKIKYVMGLYLPFDDSGIKDWRDIIDRDIPTFGPITEETREQILRESHRYRAGNVRLVTGRIYTDKEFEERRERVHKLKLP